MTTRTSGRERPFQHAEFVRAQRGKASESGFTGSCQLVHIGQETSNTAEYCLEASQPHWVIHFRHVRLLRLSVKTLYVRSIK